MWQLRSSVQIAVGKTVVYSLLREMHENSISSGTCLALRAYSKTTCSRLVVGDRDKCSRREHNSWWFAKIHTRTQVRSTNFPLIRRYQRQCINWVHRASSSYVRGTKPLYEIIWNCRSSRKRQKLFSVSNYEQLYFVLFPRVSLGIPNQGSIACIHGELKGTK